MQLFLRKNLSFYFWSGTTTIVISADHYEKEKFEQLRKGSDFEKILKNVILLNNIKTNHYKGSKTEIKFQE